MATFVPILDNELDVSSGVTDTMPARLADNVDALISQHPTAARAKIKYGSDLVYLGSGTDNKVISGAGGTAGGYFEVDTFNVVSPAIARCVGLTYIVRAKTSITIGGVIEVENSTLPPSLSNARFNMPGGIGGSGGILNKTSEYSAQTQWGLPVNIWPGSGVPAPGVGRSGAPSSGFGPELLSSFSHYLAGSSGDGANGEVGGVADQLEGGQGGGTIILISPSVTLEAGSELRVRGADAISGVSDQESRGAGGGGAIIILAETFINLGTILLDGGAGAGAGINPIGSSGGDGTFLFIEVDF